MVVALDAAAPFAGHLPARPDLTYFVTHPCHPPIYNDETDPPDAGDDEAPIRHDTNQNPTLRAQLL